MPATPDAFAGFGPRAPDFFRDLAAHQAREWFRAHRETCEREARRPMEALIADPSAGFARRGAPRRASRAACSPGSTATSASPGTGARTRPTPGPR